MYRFWIIEMIMSCGWVLRIAFRQLNIIRVRERCATFEDAPVLMIDSHDVFQAFLYTTSAVTLANRLSTDVHSNSKSSRHLSFSVALSKMTERIVHFTELIQANNNVPLYSVCGESFSKVAFQNKIINRECLCSCRLIVTSPNDVPATWMQTILHLGFSLLNSMKFAGKNDSY